MEVLDLLLLWVVRDMHAILFSLIAAILVPILVAKRRYRAMGLRTAFALSIYTVCFLLFLLLIHHNAQSLDFLSNWQNLGLYALISLLHFYVYCYHLAFGFAWNLYPSFVYGVGLPGYCFFLAIMLFIPGFVFIRLCSLAAALVHSNSALPFAAILDILPSPLVDEMALVTLFSLLFTWSIIYHQAGSPSLEVVELNIDHNRTHPKLCRLPVPHYPHDRGPVVAGGGQGTVAKSFTVAQISDPHLGLFMSARQLRGVCEELVALKPTFVFLTGDYFAAEVQRKVYAAQQLKWALEPLAAPDVKAFACLGNHDYEGLPEIQATLKSLGIRLLCDESETVRTEFGAVQIIGTHFIFSERRKADHLQKICAKFPAIAADDSRPSPDGERTSEADGEVTRPASDTIRLMLVHDPKGFANVDPEERVLAFAGHNHGGQIGLESFGIRWTLPRALLPGFTDLGLWAKGRNYWYVHRGTGQHAFPFRWGVQREKSLIKVTITN